MVSQIPCSTILSKDTWFEAISKSQIDADESSEKEDINISNVYSADEESDKNLSGQDFEKVLVMTLKKSKIQDEISEKYNFHSQLYRPELVLEFWYNSLLWMQYQLPLFSISNLCQFWTKSWVFSYITAFKKAGNKRYTWLWDFISMGKK